MANKTTKMISRHLGTALVLVVLWSSGLGPAVALEKPTCEPIKVDMCRQIGYNKTGEFCRKKSIELELAWAQDHRPRPETRLQLIRIPNETTRAKAWKLFLKA